MLKRVLALALVSFGFLVLQARAAEPATAGRLTTETIIKRTLEGRLGGAKIDAVSKTPYLGMYEVRLGSEILYTDEKMTYIFSGNVIDAKTMQNLTEKRLRDLSAIKWDDLPMSGAFKTVRGNGKRLLAVFSDPNCPYCKRFEKDLAKIDNITIYTFLYPILSQDSHDKAKAVWCSADKVKAWDELMLNAVAPAAAANCDTPIEKNLELGRKYRISGTPTLVFASGERVPGAIPAERLEKLLAQSTK
ncbi:MAG: DsbC family protein [Burkholderiales bacterium]|nr:DsbC family protein [Burkholderiales bacterium]